MRSVAATAATYIPAPEARPIAATSQRLAAVVRPLIRRPECMIAPPPRNPMPTTTFEAIRPPSTRIRPSCDG